MCFWVIILAPAIGGICITVVLGLCAALIQIATKSRENGTVVESQAIVSVHRDESEHGYWECLYICSPKR